MSDISFADALDEESGPHPILLEYPYLPLVLITVFSPSVNMEHTKGSKVAPIPAERSSDTIQLRITKMK